MKPASGTNALALALVAILAGPAVAAQPAAPAPANAADRVAESFNVGDGVYVRSLTVEPAAGALWVGTSTGVHEVEYATGKLRRTFTRKDGLANEYVFAVGVDREGYKWFGTNAGGTSRYRNGQWKTFFPMHGLADYWIYAFASQKNGDWWIGTWAGANRYDPKTGKFTTYVKELVNEWVYGIAVDAQDRVWFGTEGGVSMFDGRAWKAWTHKDGLGAPNTAGLPPSANTGLGTRARHDLATMVEGNPSFNPNYVFSVHVAGDGSVWAGTWGGRVGRFDGKRWQNFTTRDGLAGNIVYAITQDARGALWFGTSNGVSRFDGKNWRSYSRKEGLLDSNVYAVAVDPSGSVWAGTKRGVARIAAVK